jgi:Domain of unknown function (DUF4965)/Domain of unknown function (DUF1793)/Domain of unknown function (DUF5127)/Domain of unknown function (DUF4964)
MKSASRRPSLPVFRPASVPLVVHHPYFCIWSNADHLADDWSRHWTGAVHGISSLARVDGKTYRLMGRDQGQPAEQLGVEVWPTRTIYTFRCGDVNLRLMFCTPALCDDLDLLSRPVTYITYEVSAPGKKRSVQLYIDVTGQMAVDHDGDPIDTARLRVGHLALLRSGATNQRVLARSGDNLRIEWGYIYLAADERQCTSVLSFADTARGEFAKTGKLPADDVAMVQHRLNDAWPNQAFAFDLGKVGSEIIFRTAMIAFDEVFAIEYLHQKLRPWWRRNGLTIADILSQADDQRDEIFTRCEAFDHKLVSDLTKAGGAKYAALCALAYRQAIAAHALVAGPGGEPLFFSKENFSNGCIATVDVTYPSAPLFLLLQPKLLMGMLTPILQYAAGPNWKFSFAPHDLGQYPLANGQVYGGGERTEADQMPVEECGNMLILVAALVKITGKTDYAAAWWSLLSKWAEYLADKGLDPEKQLCTDDFAGHLGHNANLSLKAIIALAGYAQMASALGHAKIAKVYRKQAESMAKQWQQMADEGDHTRLAFDQPGTWSQKYNLVWDQLLELNLFPPSVARREVSFYKKMQQRFGLPLDNRKTYTKLDWIVWSATLADGAESFAALIDPLFAWLDQTPSRVPMTDWYETTDGKQVGFQARSVVGGLFIKLLKDSLKK